MKNYYKSFSNYFNHTYIPQVQALADALETRLLPSFANLDTESDEISDKHYKNLCSLPGDENVDMADLAEAAFDEGINHYLMMVGLRQGLINMISASLYHLFEQQMMQFLKKGILEIREEKDAHLHKLNIAWERLREDGIDVKSFEVWPILEELKLVANTVKHAEGPSAQKLHLKRPELFVAPGIRDFVGVGEMISVTAPLIGDGLYLAETDVVKYKEALVLFWKTLSDVIWE